MNNIATLKNKILLNIGIPTYNRAHFLENLLNNILPQVKETQGEAIVCISDNGSTDNTQQVVASFKEKYPGLINYNRNPKNLGFDRNILEVMEMSQGDFIWLFGDDDLMAEGGLNEVINFIKKNEKEKIGLIFVKTESYYIDKKNNEKVIWSNKIDKSKPEVFKIDKKDIIGMSFPEIVFISALVLNNKLVKQILKEDADVIEKAVGSIHIHAVIYFLMFLKYTNIRGIALNKRPLVYQELFSYKFFVEDKFRSHYQVQKKLINVMLSNKYINSVYAPAIARKEKKLRKEFIIDIIILKIFGGFNYFSYFGCLKLFFQEATLIDALLFSSVFSIFFLVPPAILKFLYKISLMIKYGGNWSEKWVVTRNMCSIVYSGDRRRNFFPAEDALE